jgi:uncharacterized protein (TIGR02246 family)
MVALLTLFLCGAHIGYSQDMAAQIHAVLQDQVEAWNRGDIEGYMQGYWKSDSTVFVSGGSILHGWKNVLERYKKNYGTKDRMGRLEFRELTVRFLSPTAAIVHGVWKLRRTTDTPWGRFTLIVEKKQDGWRITQDHTHPQTSKS